jgi:hypothetical protein
VGLICAKTASTTSSAPAGRLPFCTYRQNQQQAGGQCDGKVTALRNRLAARPHGAMNTGNA